MGVEIERKFLVRGDDWRTMGPAVSLRQGYLSSHPDRIVRVRIEDDAATLTIKGRTTGASRGEWEYSIPVADAETLLDTLCEKPLIEKHRTRVVYDGMIWEIDEFFGANAGLIVAEIELQSEEQRFSMPDWIGDEVTSDVRYANASLIRHPYRDWK